MPRNYFVVLLLTSLTGLFALGFGYVLRNYLDPAPVSAPASRAVVPNIKPFALVDQNEQAVTEASYRGQWLLVFFGFTRCPDICPTSMIYASDLLKELGPAAEQMKVIFVSIDPERDTPSALKDYLANFDPRIVGLTGTPEHIAEITKGYGVYYTKRKLDGVDDYTMDHSTAFYLVGPEGGLRRAYSLQRGADQMTADIRTAITPKE